MLKRFLKRLWGKPRIISGELKTETTKEWGVELPIIGKVAVCKVVKE